MNIMKTQTFKTASLLALTLGFGLIAFTAGGTPQAEAAEAVVPTVIETPTSARKASTYMEDRKLTNSCVEAGFSKSECLCVTKVTKFETSLEDYKALVAHYTRPASRMTQASITREPVVPAQGGRADMLRLIESPNFEYRCADAHRYFEANRAD